MSEEDLSMDRPCSASVDYVALVNGRPGTRHVHIWGMQADGRQKGARVLRHRRIWANSKPTSSELCPTSLGVGSTLSRVPMLGQCWPEFGQLVIIQV